MCLVKVVGICRFCCKCLSSKPAEKNDILSRVRVSKSVLRTLLKMTTIVDELLESCDALLVCAMYDSVCECFCAHFVTVHKACCFTVISVVLH